MVNKYKYIVQCNFQDLSEAQMQKIAAEMNLSETVFLRNKEKNGSFSKGITIAEVQCTSSTTWKKPPTLKHYISNCLKCSILKISMLHVTELQASVVVTEAIAQNFSFI